MKVMEDVPYVVGLDKWLGTELNDAACTYLKDFGAATASNGAVGLYHIANLTPEAKEQGEALVAEDAKVYVIDDAELQRVKDNYPVVWKNKDAKPKLCFMGCPHMSLEQLKTWTDRVEKALAEAGRSKVCIPTVFTAAPAVLKEFEKTPYAARLKKNRRHHVLYLSAYVHEQPALRQNAGHYLLQQAAHLYDRALLYRR